jgi:hypothetical protein
VVQPGGGDLGQRLKALDVRRFDARRSRLEGKTKCGGVWLPFIGSGRRWRGGVGRRSAGGGGAPSNHRLVTGGETIGRTPFYEGKRRGFDSASVT